MSPRYPQPSSFGLPPFTRGVKGLLIATVAVSVAVALLGSEYGGWLADQLAFVPFHVRHGRVWQLVTYSFLHVDPISLLLAGIFLWMIGASLEQMWGTRRFLVFYFATTATAALATFVLGLFSDRVAAYPYAGNWAALEALTAAFAVTLPGATIFLYFMPLQARYLLPISAAITALFMIFRGPLPYLPQLFGLVAGVLFAGGLRAPRQILLRVRVWWIDRRLRSRKLRIVRDADEEPLERRGRSGSDKYLH